MIDGAAAATAPKTQNVSFRVRLPPTPCLISSHFWSQKIIIVLIIYMVQEKKRAKPEIVF